MRHIPTYNSWQSMRLRCLKPYHTYYQLYGGRGIKICDRWVNSYENFLADMGERPNGKTLDRKDSDGDYTPSNCRWATVLQQIVNTRMRKDNSSGYIGVNTRNGGKSWRASIRIAGKKSFIGSFDTPEEAAYMRDQFAYALHGEYARMNVLCP